MLEAVPKLPHRDHHAGDLQEREEQLGFTFVTDDESPEVDETRHGSFGRPTTAVAA